MERFYKTKSITQQKHDPFRYGNSRLNFIQTFIFSCSYDYLELFDGNSTRSSPSLGRFCGYFFTPISSTQRFLTLQFVTDYNIQSRGFKLLYNFTTDVVRKSFHDVVSSRGDMKAAHLLWHVKRFNHHNEMISLR